MKNLQKAFAMILVVAMMLSMMSFNAFGITFATLEGASMIVTDANEAEIDSAKAGTTVYIRVYIPAGSYSAGGLCVYVPSEVAQEDVTSSCNTFFYSADDKYVNLSWTVAFTATDDPVAIIPIKIPGDASGSLNIAEDNGSFFTPAGSTTTATDFATVAIEIKQPWNVTGYEPVSAEVNLGATEEDAKKALGSTVYVTGAGEGERDPRQVTWTAVNYDGNTAADNYTFKATILPDENKLSNESAYTEDIIGTVKVKKINATIPKQEMTYQAAPGLKAADLVTALPTEHLVAAGGFEETVTIAWSTTDTSELSNVGDVMAFTGVVTSEKFNIPDVEGTVTLADSMNYRDLVAMIGNFKYKSLDAAVDAADAGATIVLQNDASEYTDMSPANIDKNVTIDLNGKIYTGDITVADGATVTFIGDGKVYGNITGDITVEGGAFYGEFEEGATITATGGSFPEGTKATITTPAGYHTVTMSDGRIAVAENAEEATDKITLEFRPTADVHVFDIYLVAEDGTVINEFVSAEFEFTNTSTTTSGADMLYDIDGTAAITAERALKEVNEVGAEVQTWGFAVQDKDNHNDIISAAEIQLGTVTFDGYGQINFKATAGVVHTTLEATNNEFHYITDGTAEDGNILDIVTDAISGDEGKIEEKKRTVNVNLHFVNDITAGVETTYNQMEVSIVGENADYEDPAPVAIGDDLVESNTLAKASFEVVAGYRYTVTVKGAGYRTARYTTIVDEVAVGADNKMPALELNFWNNVKSGSGEPFAEIEEGVSGLSAKNFLAGDIAMDNIIDKYDLAAVISYFGTYELDKDHEPQYVKYDLNRDGKIDSEDIAYVLYSIGE